METPFTYGSVCSGIEAATVAWAPLGWRAAWFAEVDAFPSAVLAHHYPGTPNLGDFTRIEACEGPVDLLVGGTPCQSFSVAGLRGGLGDDRGNLALEYLRLAGRLRPRWLVWENVPGVLSSGGGRDLGAFLGAMEELGYGWAYRVLDAQHFGVPQRRRRVFVVGHLGDWRCPAAVLFERESLRGDTPKGREAGAGTASSLTGSLGRRNGQPGKWGEVRSNLIPHAYGGKNTSGPIDVATARNAHAGPHGRLDFDSETFVVDLQNTRLGGDVAGTLDTSTPSRGGGQAVLAPIPFDTTQITSSENRCRPEAGDPCHPLAAQAHPPTIANRSAVRRLTPRECERLQGFPDDYTLVTFRGKPAADGPRYKALGNSMAVPVVAWIGRRIEKVRSISLTW